MEQVPSEAAVHPVPYPQGRASKVARRFAPKAIWLPRAFAAVRRLMRTHRPDVVLTSGPPHCVHWLGLYLKRRHGLPWIDLAAGQLPAAAHVGRPRAAGRQNSAGDDDRSRGDIGDIGTRAHGDQARTPIPA